MTVNVEAPIFPRRLFIYSGRMTSTAHDTPIRFDPTRAQGPLDGIRVLDLSRLVAGNMLSLQLADFGADVIKVEPPAGDPLRDWRDAGQALHWKTYARNKRSLVLNLRHAAPPRTRCCVSSRRRTCSSRTFAPARWRRWVSGPTFCTRQIPSCHRARLRLRPDRALRAAARLRHPGRGDERLCGAHRFPGPRAGAAAARARRHDRRPLRRVRHRDRRARTRARARPAGR